MDESDKRAGGAFLGGVGATLVSTVATQAFPGAPVWIWQGLFCFGVGLMIYGVISAAVHRWRPPKKAPVRGVHPPGKQVVGGRAEDRRGTIIGPLPTAEALNMWDQRDVEPEAEFIPLDEAARWLYDNAEPWLQEALRRPEPFPSIVEHAAALVGTAADEGVGELRASREPGLKPEPVRFSELKPTAFEAMFEKEKRFPVDPVFRRADLPKVLDYYKEPFAAPDAIKVRRDAPLLEALMFAVTGKWGLSVATDIGDHVGAVGEALEEFRQLAHDGTITVWGRTNNHGVWQKIGPEYWIGHYVDFLDLLRSETRTKPYSRLSAEPVFSDLMVSRAEFEAERRGR